MGRLLFQRSDGTTCVVNEKISRDQVMPAIYEDVDRRSHYKFKIYYVRTWYDTENRTEHFDVGSHTEFYLFEEE